MIHRLRSCLGRPVSRARRAAFPLLSAGALVVVAASCVPDDRYVQCDTPADCGTYEVDDETWRYACVTTVTATTRGSFCTRECRRSCASIGGYEATCLRFDGDDEGFCYQRCERDEDCYPSSRCVETDGVGWRGTLCLPDQRRRARSDAARPQIPGADSGSLAGVMRFASRLFLPVALASLSVAAIGCADGGSTVRDTDGGVDPGIDGGPPLEPECVADSDDCPTGFVCAAVSGIPRCVPDLDRPPPGDGTDCRPCEAPGECRDGVCVQPTPSGSVCEFDPECGMDELCISGRCTWDPRIPIPCTDDSMCPPPLTCGPDGVCVCAVTTDCPIGLECVDAACVPGPGGDACVADMECPAEYVCEAGRCRPRTLCDITNPDLSGTWMMTSTLRMGEALPSWIAAVEEPFRFLGGDSTCIDWDDLPGWVDTAICDLVRPYLDMYLPPWSRPVFRAIADLNVVLDEWVIDETMTLTAGAVTDAYRGSHTWDRITFMYRAMPITGDPASIMDWRFSPSDFNASAVCGQFNIERHAINVSIGSIIAWLIDAIIYEVSEHRWSGLRAALTDVADGFCMGLAAAAEDNIDYAGVGSTVMSVCGGLVAAAIDSAIDAVVNARIGADAITLRGTAPISGPGSLTPGTWDGTILGRGFTGDFDARR